MQFNFKKGDIAVIMVDESRKYVRLTDNIVHSGYLYIVPCNKIWDVVIRPVQRPDGLAMDTGIIPTSQALDMIKNDESLFLIPDSKSVIISKLDPNSDKYKSLIAESINMILP